MKTGYLRLVLLAIALLNASSARPARAQPPMESHWLAGTVTELRKYSVKLAAHGNEWNVQIPDGVPIWLQLERPQFDAAPHRVRMEIWASASDGDPQRNIVREFPLPDPCWIDVEFAHENERQRAMSEEIKRFVRYRLHSQPPRPDEANDSPLQWNGRLVKIDGQGLAHVQSPQGAVVAELGSREAFLTEMSAAEWEPFATTLRARVVEWEGQWVAQEIHFRALVDPFAGARPGLPHLLVLGDEVSLSYHAALKAELADRFHVVHPPDNCRGSGNWTRLGEWLGPYQVSGRQWDVILFNCGLADLSMPTAEYQANLRRWIEALQPTRARLLWVETMPVPTQFAAREEGQDPNREIQRLNAAAREVLRDYPAIGQIPLYDWAESQSDEGLRGWWRGRSATFPATAAPLVARQLSAALGE